MNTITFEEAAQRFHQAGMRMTKARESLLKLVLESSDPFSVKTLHERADHAGLDMHLATVHRNLAEFVEVGIVDKLPSEDNNLFSLHIENEAGAHVFCLDCRNLVPLAGTTFNNGDQMNALSEALMQRGFDASTVRLMLAAHCRTQSCSNNEG